MVKIMSVLFLTGLEKRELDTRKEYVPRESDFSFCRSSRDCQDKS